jgi:hypothetical protein
LIDSALLRSLKERLVPVTGPAITPALNAKPGVVIWDLKSLGNLWVDLRIKDGEVVKSHVTSVIPLQEMDVVRVRFNREWCVFTMGASTDERSTERLVFALPGSLDKMEVISKESGKGTILAGGSLSGMKIPPDDVLKQAAMEYLLSRYESFGDPPLLLSPSRAEGVLFDDNGRALIQPRTQCYTVKDQDKADMIRIFSGSR